MEKLNNSWDLFFNKIQHKEYFQNLLKFIDDAYRNSKCFPNASNIFNAFKFTPIENVKIVIFGQDPYHEINQAMGLSFSVPSGIKVPPSLINIYREIESEFDCFMNYSDGDLTYLANQGVLLLNAILTVEEGKPLSHNIKEYELLFKDVLEELNNTKQKIIYLLWGAKAKKYARYIKEDGNHIILYANHPSPVSANRGGWFGCNHFKKANEILLDDGYTPINWSNALIK